MSDAVESAEGEVEEIGPHPGPQTKALASPADILIFGGSAGGGKSYVLELEAARHISNPLFRAVYFRRQAVDLMAPKGLWDTSQLIYPHIGGKAREDKLRWTFESGAWLKFGHLQLEKDKYSHQGAEYPLCASIDTDVLMADGSYRRLADIKVGDVVATLQGPRTVTRAMTPQRKQCVEVTTATASIVVSADHQMLHENHWGAPTAQTPTRCREPYSTRGASLSSLQAPPPPPEYPSAGRLRAESSLTRTLQGTAHRVTDASSGDGRNGCGASGGSRQVPQQPRALSGRLVLAARAVHSAEQESARASRRHAHTCERKATREDRGCSRGCRGDRDCGGGPLRSDQEGDEVRTPTRGDAVERTFGCLPAGGPDSTQARIQPGRFEYCHPYTKARQVAHEDVLLSPAVFAPAGERAVRDLTVEGASHWIARGGFVSRNCCFDELNHFTESQFWYLLTRNRAPKRAGIRPYIRASTNPDPDSWVRSFIDWWIGKDGLPIPERDGVLRWFARDGDDIIWGDSPADVQRQAPHIFNARLTPDVVCKSVTFIRSRLSDNPSMGVEYEATLMAADAVTRARLLDGNWNVRHAAGDMFKRKWFPVTHERAPASARRVRCWDLASTNTKKSDWTAGVLLAEWQGLYWVEDVQVLRGTPAEVEQLVARTAAGDGRRVDVYIEQEVAAAGVTVLDHYKRTVLKGYSVHAVKVKSAGTKTERAKPASAACQPLTEGLVGLVQVVRDPSWNERFFGELEGFPTVRGDDVVDAFVGAFNSMAQGVVVYGGRG